MKQGKMGGRGHVRRLFTLTLTVILVFGFGNNLINNGNVEDQSTDDPALIEKDTTENRSISHCLV